jgi:general secretion pathway protein B
VSQVSSGAVSIDAKQEAIEAPSPTATEALPTQVAQAATAEEAPVPKTPEIGQKMARPEPPKSNPVPVPAKKKKPETIPATAAPPEKPQSIERKKPRAEPAKAVVAEPRLPGFRDLPENIQREIPALTVGGYIYSSVAAERSILINNRLLREGSEIGHGLVLEKMLPKEAVLNYKGYRYRVPY